MHTLLKQSLAPGQSPPTCIGLLRHGKTLWNEEGRIQGREDSPLSPAGREQVEQWGSYLQKITIDQIIASDLGRVRETVAILQQYRPPTAVYWDPALREQNWGDWQGKTFKELKETEGETLARQIRAGWDFCPPQGESRRDLLKRCLPRLQEIAVQFPGKKILVVCHEGIIKTIIYHLAGRAFLPEEKKLLKKRQMHIILSDDGELRLGPLNILPKWNQSENQ
jgi:probable phosphoglycerate mutase